MTAVQVYSSPRRSRKPRNRERAQLPCPRRSISGNGASSVVPTSPGVMKMASQQKAPQVNNADGYSILPAKTLRPP